MARLGAGASMAAIAAEAGITKPVLYRHFGAKGGLYTALAERHTEQLLSVLRRALAAGGDPRDRFARTVDAYLRSIESAPGLYRFLLHSPEAHAAGPGPVATFLERLADLLARGIGLELGLDPASVRARVWARGIVGMVQACGDWWIDTGAPARSRLVRELTDLVWGAYPAALAGGGAGARR